ncbi:hypothetical protein [Erythrobacter sp. MTPC3]|uniref:hypothetical protein n=1 Tax=Erythrobacter sp. MTPC3 TaxID=3056564 RepID=UPI0036F1A42F
MTLAACGGQPASPEPPSDPTDFFYREAWQENITIPPIRWHEQAPGRYFETTLRPTEMNASLPTSYLSRITRNYQPWAKEIYDVAYLGFDLDRLTALPPDRSFGWGTREEAKPDEVLIQLGGYEPSSYFTPERITNIWDGEITETDDHVIITSERFPGGRSTMQYFFNQPSKGDLDGNPVIVDCASDWKCTADLVVPQEFAGHSPLYLGKNKPYRGTTGARLRVTFHPDRIDDWEEVRRKAACFAALSIEDLELASIAPVDNTECNDVRSAIERSIAS